MPGMIYVGLVVLLTASFGVPTDLLDNRANRRSATALAALGAPGSPTVRVQRYVAVSTLRIPADVRWTAPPEGTVASYRLQRSVDGGSWTNVAIADPRKPRALLTLDAWRVYALRVAAVNSSGQIGAWSAVSRFRGRQAIETEDGATYAGAWARKSSQAYLEASTRVTKAAGATAQFIVNQQGVAWVATQGPGRGSAGVYVDGVRVATVNLSASTVRLRQVVWTRAWPDAASRTVEIRVENPGTAGVDLDGLMIVEAPTAHPVLAGAGDIASCKSTGDEATADLLDAIEGTVFTAGDNVYTSGTPDEFAQCYEPSWGRHRERTRPVPGNHDYYTAGAAGYKGYFGPAATPQGKTWYAYDLGAWRIYALDSECTLVGGCGSSSPQGQWLANDLARHPRRCVAAIWHVPLFSSGWHGNDPRMSWIWRTLDTAGAELVIAGHEHDYERFARQYADGTASSNGMREIVVGTGGILLRSFGTVRRNSQVRWSKSHGVLKLTLRPASYSWRFVPVGGTTFSDSGTTTCG